MWLQDLLNKRRTFETLQHSYLYRKSVWSPSRALLAGPSACLNVLSFKSQEQVTVRRSKSRSQDVWTQLRDLRRVTWTVTYRYDQEPKSAIQRKGGNSCCVEVKKWGHRLSEWHPCGDAGFCSDPPSGPVTTRPLWATVSMVAPTWCMYRNMFIYIYTHV